MQKKFIKKHALKKLLSGIIINIYNYYWGNNEDMMDICPTLCKLAGVSLEGMEGKPLDIFK